MLIRALRSAARWSVPLLLATILAGLLFEAGVRYFPVLVPRQLKLEKIRWRLGGWGALRSDPVIGVVVGAPVERRIASQGKTIRLRHIPFPGEPRVGYRAGAEGPDVTKSDIVAMGDSHAYNFEMDEDETWESRLSQLTGWSVANLALPYQGTAQYELWYSRYGVRLRPKLVLMMLCPNDFSDNKIFHDWVAQRDRGEAIFQRYRFRVMIGWPEPLADLARWANQSLLIRRLIILPRLTRKAAVSEEEISRPPEALEGLIADVDKTRILAAARGARFAVILTDIWWGDWKAPLAERLKEGLRRRGIPALDLAERMCTATGCPLDLRLPDDQHWNERGQVRVAEEIRRFIGEERLPPAAR